jgi:hypothetical protein
MSGAFINVADKELNKLFEKVMHEVNNAEAMNLFLDSDIIIKYEKNYYIAYFHVSS